MGNGHLSVCPRLSDEELLAASATDPDAFGEFYYRHVDAIVAFFRRRVVDPELACDLAAETFAGALASVSGFAITEGVARGWLFAIARHKLADAMRLQRLDDRTRRALAIQPLRLDDETLATVDRIAARGVLALLDELPAAQRDAIVARYIDGREYDEIAATQCCPESLIRKRVSRGVIALRRIMREKAS